MAVSEPKDFNMSVRKIGHLHFFYTGPLGNWNRGGPFTDPITGIGFANTEQAFMWYKADFFKDEKMKNAIAAQPDPREAKELGRLVANYNDSAWEAVRFGFMVYVNYLKFSQNKDKRDYLLATGNEHLVEASPVDVIWGIGLDDKTDEKILRDPMQWKGRNLLGEALMKVRDMLNENPIP
jgi:ribA/ribD-fused uncharacterized protein